MRVETCKKSYANELQMNLVVSKKGFGMFLTKVSVRYPSGWPKVL